MPVAQTLAELPLTPAQPPDVPAAGIGSGRSSPARLALERQLSGTVFVAPSLQAAAPSAAAEAGGAPAAAGPATHAADGADLTALLRPGARPTAAAGMLPTQRLLLPKGAFIDCTLETAIDSTLPGMTTCVTATDTFGVDGRVVLLERGTKLVGETRGGVSQGAARLFVLWTEARTPAGVIVPLDSPGADALGRAGLGGTVNRHFWQRFGAAMLVSVLDGAVQAAASSRSAGGGTVVMNPSASAGVITEVLRDTINIPPTIILRNGERIQVLVARDLDFRSVYALRPVGGGG
jgi:type IV secretion system protein VirB10